MQRPQARLLLVASVVVVLGSLLPWHTVHGGGRSLNIDGIDAPNNGLVTLGFGLALGVVAWRMVERGNRPRRTVLALSIGTAVTTVWALIDASNADDDFIRLTLERAYGQWVLLAGAIMALVVGVLMARPEQTADSTAAGSV